MDLYEPDVGTAYYRSNDPINNVRVRVSLKKATSNLVPQSVTEDGAGNMELKDMDTTRKDLNDEEEVMIQWQEKIFCQREVLLYADRNNCSTVLEQKYHDEVLAIQARGQGRNRIFTYVDHNKFCHRDEAQEPNHVTIPETGEQTVLAKRMAQVRRRRVGGKQLREREKNAVPKINVVDMNPTNEFMSRSHVISPPMQMMYVMADLTPKNEQPKEEYEYILCEMVVGANGMLMVRPDFNRGRKSYVIESHSPSRDIYEYSIEHISKEMNRQEHDRELKMYKELYARHSTFLQACVGHEFEMPPPDTLRLVVMGEIESVKDFDADDLYLHFFVDMPKNWYAHPHQQLSWVTQTCRTKVVGRDNVAYFSFPFNFELMYKDIAPQEEKKEKLIAFPFLLVEVLSLDSWSRFNTEGYTCISIPFKPGTHCETKDCWRPCGTSIVSQLRRFFIGGSPEMEDVTYTALPSTFMGSHLSKFGFRTEATGSVTVRFNTILQSRNFLMKKAKKQSVGAMMDNLGITSAQTNISSVLDAFKKARLKMMQAREAASRELLRETPANKKQA